MKILTGSCENKPAPITLDMVPVGSVFRYGAHTAGPYMRTTYGTVDLSTGSNTSYAAEFTHAGVLSNGKRGLAAVVLPNYHALPNAVLYTGE